MKALFKDALYLVVEDDGQSVLLNALSPDRADIWVSYDDAGLILDPTDDEVAGAENSPGSCT